MHTCMHAYVHTCIHAYRFGSHTHTRTNTTSTTLGRTTRIRITGRRSITGATSMSGTNTSRSSSDTGTGSTADTCSFPTSPHHHIWNRIPMGGQVRHKRMLSEIQRLVSKCPVVLLCCDVFLIGMLFRTVEESFTSPALIAGMKSVCSWRCNGVTLVDCNW